MYTARKLTIAIIIIIFYHESNPGHAKNGGLKQVVFPKKNDDHGHDELACSVHHFPPVQCWLILIPEYGVRFEEQGVVAVLPGVQQHK